MSMFDELVNSLSATTSVKLKMVVRTPFQSFDLSSDKLTDGQRRGLLAFVMSCSKGLEE